MIAEIAAANASFAVIKAALANGKELSALGSRVFDYFDNKARIQEKATQKGGGSDLEEFMALEQFKQQEEELRERMVYAGRPGMWDDWVKFQAAAARRRLGRGFDRRAVRGAPGARGGRWHRAPRFA